MELTPNAEPEKHSAPSDFSRDKPVTLIPVTAEDVRRQKIRLWTKILSGITVLLLAAFFVWKRSTDPIDARQSFDAGERQLQAARYGEAVLSLGRAISLQSRFPEAYFLRGRAYLGLNDLEHAIGDFSKTIELSPADTEAYIARANARLVLREFREVVEDCGQVLKLRPNSALAYNLRGVARRELGDTTQALADLSKAVELAPNVDNYFERGALYQKLGDHQHAVEDFTHAIELQPDLPHLYYARSASRAQLGDAAGAKQDHRRARYLDGR